MMVQPPTFTQRHPILSGFLFAIGTFATGIIAAPLLFVAARWWWSLFL